MVPADRLTKTSDARLSGLLARVLSRKEPEAQLDLLRSAPWLAVQDPERTLLAACRARILSPYDDEVAAAVRATLARSTEDDIPALRTTLEAARSDPRTFSVALKTLFSHGRGRRVYVLAAAAAEAASGSDPALAPARVRCARVARPDQLAAVLEEVAAADHFSSDVSAEARDAIQALSFDDLLALESALASSAHAELRRLAVRALERDAGPGRGWTAERLERLARYQRDPSPIVSGAANVLFPPRELAPSRARTGSP